MRRQIIFLSGKGSYSKRMEKPVSRSVTANEVKRLPEIERNASRMKIIATATATKCREKPKTAFISKITSEKVKRNRRLYQIFVAVLCSTLFLWQLGLNLKRFWSYPVTTLISISDVDTIYLPSVTICNNNYRFLDMLLQLSEGSIRNKGLDINCCDDLLLFWQEYGIMLQQISTHVPCDYSMQHNSNLVHCVDYHSSGEVTIDKTVLTPLGQCIDLTLKYPAHQRIFGFAIRIKENENIKRFYPNVTYKEYYNIFAHEKNVFYKNNIFVNARAPQYNELWISYEKKQYKRLNSPINQCQDVQDHIDCLDKCVERKWQEEANCQLPNMLSDLPQCKNWTEVARAFEVAHRLHATGQLYDCPSCIRACEAFEYKVNRIESMKQEDNDSIISIELENRFDEKVEERYVYPFSSLINDLAALVGFFMGISLPGLMDFIEMSGRRLLMCFKKNGQ